MSRASLFVFWLALLLYLPAALSAFDPHEVIKIQADYLEFQQETGLLIGKGHVVITQGENWLKGEHVVYQVNEKKVIVHGQGSFFNGKETLTGEEIVYDAQTGQGSARDVITKQDPWQFQSQQIEQLEPKTYYASQQTSITTCDNKPTPHYHLEAKEVLIYQDERIVARGVTMYFGHVPVIYLPSFTYALKHRNYYLNVGYGEKYGMWLKGGYNYDLSKNHYGTLYLDWWERRGLAKGIKHNFRWGETGVGSLYYYCIREQEVLYDSDLGVYYNDIFPQETNRTKFAGRYWMDVFSPLNVLKVDVDLTTDPKIEYELTEDSLSVIYNRVSSVTLERTTNNYNLEIYGEKIDNYDTEDQKYYLYAAQLPKISFATNRLSLFSLERSNFYHQYQFHFTNTRSWADRETFLYQEDKDYYEQSGDVAAALANTTPLSRKDTLSSMVTLKEEWQDHRSVSDMDDLFVTKTLTNVTWRRILGQFFTNDFSHQTIRRYTEIESSVYKDYRGWEKESFGEKLTFKEPWWRTSLTSSVEYDLREANGTKTNYWAEKFLDLVTEINTYPLRQQLPKDSYLKQLNLYSKIIVDPYGSPSDHYHDAANLKESFLLKEVEVTARTWIKPALFFEYTQRRHFQLQNYADWPAQELALNTNYANFKANLTLPLTEKWKLNSQFEYRNPHIRKRYAWEDFRLFEDAFTLTRDLHCWEVAFFYRTTPEPYSPRRDHQVGFDFHLKAFPGASNVSTDFPPKMFWFQ